MEAATTLSPSGMAAECARLDALTSTADALRAFARIADLRRHARSQGILIRRNPVGEWRAFTSLHEAIVFAVTSP